MPAIYQGDKKIVDRYISETLITTAYQGDKLIFDASYSELSGTLPLTVRSRASQILKNYTIYGTSSGAGVETENLFDKSAAVQGAYVRFNDQIVQDSAWAYSDYIAVLPEQAYTIVQAGRVTSNLIFYDSNKTNIGYAQQGEFVSTPENCYFVRFNLFVDNLNACMFVPGYTAPSSYIPHGYKLPLKVTADGTTTDYPVYIGDSQLGEEEYVDYESGKVYKRTENLCFKRIPLANIGENGVITASTEYSLFVAKVEQGKVYSSDVNVDEIIYKP